MKATAKRALKRMMRRAAPNLTDRLSVALRAARGAAVQNAARFGNLTAHMREAQAEFDDGTPIDDARVVEVAANSSVVVVGVAPFDNVSLFVDELREEKVDVGEIIVVDATAEEPRLVAIRDHVASWKRRLPLTRFKVVPYLLQDVRYGEILAQGWLETTHRYVWIVGHRDIPLGGCFTYLFKTLLEYKEGAVIVTSSVAPDARMREITVDARPVVSRAAAILDERTNVDLISSAVVEVELPHGKLAPNCAVEMFSEGIFGGPRALLVDESDQILDARLITNLSVTESSQRIGRRGVPMIRSGCAFSRSMLGKLTDGFPSWEIIHDLRCIGRDRAATSHRNTNPIDIVCPFHRGDVILAVQVAACAAMAGKNVRLHVAEQLVPWAKEFKTTFDIESVPVPIAAAKDTYPVLLDSYQYVSLRQDSAPRIARCHPSRSLSETGLNLVEYMLEEVGLPLDTRLLNLPPTSTDEQRQLARELVGSMGANVVFVHPLGGWDLKSIPPHVMSELSEELHRAGLKIIQIGGAGDRQIEHTDGAILRNFMPSQWKEILLLGRMLIGVDSWTSHFAAILDIPQICLYGSTHPKHVSSKRWFSDQMSPCLNMGPIVNCSPCNSLTCVAYPDRDYCTGYAVDRMHLRKFLVELGIEMSRLE